MKKLSTDQMKNVKGGDEDQLTMVDDSGTCSTSCYTSSGATLSCVGSGGFCVPPSSCSNTSSCK
jgi:hypothetical protein